MWFFSEREDHFETEECCALESGLRNVAANLVPAGGFYIVLN